jgi:N-acetyl-beta-hexosaminidase
MSSAQNSKFKIKEPNLLPCPRSQKLLGGTFTLAKQKPLAAVKIVRINSASDHPEGYTLTISKTGIEISFPEAGGLRAAAATLRQLLRQYGRRLPCLKIRDWPDFPRRGVMLDISRGRVPKLETSRRFQNQRAAALYGTHVRLSQI